MPKPISIVGCVLAALTTIAAANSTFAASITWTVGDIDGANGQGDLSVSTQGTLIEAANFGGTGAAAVAVVVNTVPFSAVTFPGQQPTNLSGLTYDAGSSSQGTSTAGQIDVLTDTFAFDSGVDPQMASLTGLTVGDEYLVQFFLSAYGIAAVRTLDIIAGDTATLRTREPAQFATGTFIADAMTQAIEFDASTGSQLMNGFQLRNITPIPEPSAIAIWSLLGALGGIFAWRHRRAASQKTKPA